MPSRSILPHGRRVHARRSASRAMPVILSVLAASLLIAGPARGWTQSHFIIGTYWDPYVANDPSGPSYSDSAAIATDVARFELARSAWFNLITGKSNYSRASQRGGPHGCAFGTSTALADYLLYLGSRTGMQVLVADNGVYGCGTVGDAAAATAHYLDLDDARRGAFYGYNVRDEPGWSTSSTRTLCQPDTRSTDFGCGGRNQEVIRHYRTHDPSRLAYINLRPYSTGKTCYEAYLDDYLNPTDPRQRPDVASFDAYPFTSTGVSRTYFYNLEIVRRKAGTRPLWTYPLTIEHRSGTTDFISPSDEHFRFMTFCPLAYGAKGLVYFTYVAPNCPESRDTCPHNVFCGGTALVIGADVPTAKFDKVKTINHYITKLVGPMIMASTHLGAFHKSSAPTGETPPVLITGGGTPLVGDVSDPNVLVGVFREDATPTTNHVLVVNKNHLGPVTTLVSLKGDRAGRVSLAPSVVGYSGSTTYSPVSVTYDSMTNRSTFSVTLAAGEGRLVKVIEYHQ
jgi:hypothetical protein